MPGHPNLFKPTGFYVTILNDSRLRYARGPFDRYSDALAAVEPTQRLASELDPWSDFYGWGVTRYETSGELPIGPMNKLFS